ncbi:hypothetical protein BHM03_00054778 [Ensete ventricosum]|nr:hypothetical protein BHM03_00054778 [Ensete ventricosum]
MVEPIEESKEDDLELEEENMKEDSQPVDYMTHTLAGHVNLQAMKVEESLKQQLVTILIKTRSPNDLMNGKVKQVTLHGKRESEEKIQRLEKFATSIEPSRFHPTKLHDLHPLLELAPEVEAAAVEVVVTLDMVQVTAPDMVRAAVGEVREGMVEEEEEVVEAAVEGEKEEVKALAPVPGMAMALDMVKVPVVGVLGDTVVEAAEVAAGEKGLVKARDMGLAMAMDPATVLVLVVLRVEVMGVVEVVEAAVERALAPALVLAQAQAQAMVAEEETGTTRFELDASLPLTVL